MLQPTSLTRTTFFVTVVMAAVGGGLDGGGGGVVSSELADALLQERVSTFVGDAMVE